jgi:cytosine/uracil/thiamine/allantoin permease
MWFGMQAFWGGQATRVMIGAIIPGKHIFPPVRNILG